VVVIRLLFAVPGDSRLRTYQMGIQETETLSKSHTESAKFTHDENCTQWVLEKLDLNKRIVKETRRLWKEKLETG